MTGEEYIKEICSKVNVHNSELLDTYNFKYDPSIPRESVKKDMFRNMIDVIIKIKEENNSKDNPNVDIYAALVCIERLCNTIEVIVNSRSRVIADTCSDYDGD